MKTEIDFLKDRLKITEGSKTTFFQDIQKQYQEMHNKLLENEKNYFNRLREMKEELQGRNNLNKNQARQLADIKFENLIGQNEHLKGRLESLERRLMDQAQAGLSSNTDSKQWMERQLQAFKEEIVTPS